MGGEVVLGGKPALVADLAEEPGGQLRPTPNNSSRVKRLARTWQMLVGISELVSYGLYQLDLHSGEVFVTGRPSGVALGSKSCCDPATRSRRRSRALAGCTDTVAGMRCLATPGEA